MDQGRYIPPMQDNTAVARPGGSPLTLAAVDLGSNSFHMVVMRQSDAGLQVVDRVREPVRLAAGLRADKSLTAETRERALECLRRFGSVLRGIPAEQSRVLGTNTLRRLGSSSKFLREAEAALGRPLEVISGVEEARLIYGGVTHGLGSPDERRLVMDIGGGSTELIVGTGSRPQLMESVHMGCVSYTQKYFADGKISPRRLQRARMAAAAEVEFLEGVYRQAGWDVAMGASGSVRSVWRVASELGFSQDHLSREGVEAVAAELAKVKHIDKIRYEGLREDRRAVFVGSFTVLAGLFDALGLEQLEISDRALREGIIYDLLGRLSDDDVREQSVRQLCERFTVGAAQAGRVWGVVQHLFAAAAPDWDLDATRDPLYLRWASSLHELGLAISHAGFHKHGAYVLAKADMHGFSRRDQWLLASLVRLHRGRLAQEVTADLPPPWDQRLLKLAVLLRLAVLLCRARQDAPGPSDVALIAGEQQVHLRLSPQWLRTHPLVAADLEAEAERWLKAGWALQWDAPDSES